MLSKVIFDKRIIWDYAVGKNEEVEARDKDSKVSECIRWDQRSLSFKFEWDEIV